MIESVLEMFTGKTETGAIIDEPVFAHPKIDITQRVVIMAAGGGSRWNNYLGIPKQLAPVNGEPIIKRAIRLLKDRGITDIWVTVRAKGQYGDLGVREYLNAKDNKYSIDRIYGARELAPAIYLYGDVYYTEQAMDIILSDMHKARFFGRRHPGKIKANREIYAIKADQGVIKKAMELRQQHIEGKVKNSLGGHLLIHCLGIPLNIKRREYLADAKLLSPLLTDIDDETTDFDKPAEYLAFLRLHKKKPPQPMRSLRPPVTRRAVHHTVKPYSKKPIRDYYTIDRLRFDLVHQFLPKLPQFDLIIGIPRDGVIIAYLISIYRNIPFTDLTSFCQNGGIYQPGIKHRNAEEFTAEIKTVLMVDDICASGTAMRDARAQLPTNSYQVSTGALYVTRPEEKVKVGLIDYWGCELSGPRHYEWTHCDAVHLPNTFMDIDGILTPDWHGGEDSGPAYEAWLSSVPLKVRPKNIGTLITWRREQDRAVTEAWLAKHGITYGQLIMAEREKWPGPADYKAHHYKISQARLFIESSAKQAERIYRLTHKPVVAFDTNEAWGLE